MADECGMLVRQFFQRRRLQNKSKEQEDDHECDSLDFGAPEDQHGTAKIWPRGGNRLEELSGPSSIEL